MERCERCQKKLSNQKDRFCPKHALQVLKEQLALGYLQELQYRTLDGEINLASKHQKFLTVAEPGMEMSEPNCSDC